MSQTFVLELKNASIAKTQTLVMFVLKVPIVGSFISLVKFKVCAVCVLFTGNVPNFVLLATPSTVTSTTNSTTP